MNGKRSTTSKSNSNDDYFLDVQTLMRSVLDATNLINLRWFLYDQARREAWLERVAKEAADHDPGTSGSVASRDRRIAKRRAADSGLAGAAYSGDDMRRGKDRRDRAA